MRVLFAPDWRAGNQYQSLLAGALAQEGIDVLFPQGWRRGLPLTRMIRDYRPDLVHLHWPEAYYAKGNALDTVRLRRFPFDLRLALRHALLAVTAHNLVPHNIGASAAVRRNQELVYRRAAVTFVHSEHAGATLVDEFGVPSAKLCVVPHGDLSVSLGEPLPRDAARRQLGLSDKPICLMIGVVRPYKGVEEVLDFWRERHPAATLVIAGKPGTDDYRDAIETRAAGLEGVHLDLVWQTEERLRLWLSAADCVLFNYTKVLTSGAAPLARAWGIPLLLPRRLDTVDLGEPHPAVLRFDDLGESLEQTLRAALRTAPSWEAGADWRQSCAWAVVARQTAARYHAVLSGSRPPTFRTPETARRD